jgi:monofunctional glycosyltransferase
MIKKLLIRLSVLILLGVLAVQVFFLARILMMRWIAPESTSFERSSAYQIATTKSQPWAFGWRQTWVPYE